MNITNGTEIDSVMSWLAKTINVESVSRILATLIVIIGTVYAMFPKVSYYLRVRQAAKVLSRAPLKFTRKLPDFVLPRQDVMSSLHGGLNDPDFNTVLVYGERGSGKTTAIEWNLRKRLGVFQWTVLATEGPAATVELEDKWIRIFRQWMKPEDSDFELDVCSYHRQLREPTCCGYIYHRFSRIMPTHLATYCICYHTFKRIFVLKPLASNFNFALVLLILLPGMMAEPPMVLL